MSWLRIERWPGVLLLAAAAAAAAQPVREIGSRILTFESAPVAVESAPVAVERAPVAVERAPVADANTLRLALFVHLFEGSRWRADELEAPLGQTRSLLRACGVALDQVTLIRVDAPPRFRRLHTPSARALMRMFDARRPAIFMVDENLNRPAFDAETFGRSNTRTRPELADTIWVAHGARDLGLVLAHELVHLLTDSGEHSDAPGNLMREDTSPDNTRLDAAQCERLRASPLLGSSVVKP